MDVDALKKQFSLALFKEPGNPFKAACEVFPDDFSKACSIAIEWPNNPEIISMVNHLNNVEKELNESIEDNEVLPIIADKNEALELAWMMASSNNMLGKDRVAALKLFAEMSNYMPDKTINKNINVSEAKVNKVMVIKDMGSIEDWEAKAVIQQRVLANG